MIIETVPKRGATDVDPDLSQISVTFDRDMQGGMSWTGNEKTFMPQVPEGAKPRWIDKPDMRVACAFKERRVLPSGDQWEEL